MASKKNLLLAHLRRQQNVTSYLLFFHLSRDEKPLQNLEYSHKQVGVNQGKGNAEKIKVNIMPFLDYIQMALLYITIL